MEMIVDRFEEQIRVDIFQPDGTVQRDVDVNLYRTTTITEDMVNIQCYGVIIELKGDTMDSVNISYFKGIHGTMTQYEPTNKVPALLALDVLEHLSEGKLW